MAVFKKLVNLARRFDRCYNRMLVLGTLQRDLTPHIVFADLREKATSSVSSCQERC